MPNNALYFYNVLKGHSINDCSICFKFNNTDVNGTNNVEQAETAQI